MVGKKVKDGWDGWKGNRQILWRRSCKGLAICPLLTLRSMTLGKLWVFLGWGGGWAVERANQFTIFRTTVPQL
jgi:hypothetical protein